MFLQNDLKNESFAWQPFFSKFLDFKILYDLNFHQIHLVNVYFHKKDIFFIVQSIIYIYAFLLTFFIKKIYFRCLYNYFKRLKMTFT
jgi:hypothetical protein